MTTAPRTPRAILFDVGMTLVHPDGAVIVEELAAWGVVDVSAADAGAALQMVCDASHMRLPAGHDAVGRTGLAFAGALGLPPEPTVAALRKCLTERDLYRELEPGAAPVLNALRDLDIMLGVVSNSDGTLLEELDRWSLRGYFEVIVDSTVVEVSKPDPGIFRIAVDQLQVSAEECWYVGDHIVNDVVGGMAAGIGEIILFDRFDLYRHIPGVHRITELSELAILAGGR
ncbi:HAD family hydrolase [Rhodococcus pyridinivorans]|uniref:HAD-IA family hydrolase n=1 Tax=Rhodococcus pyridinivorans TaxID=103816 RepID=A0A7M2XVS4_9NOCA|nr:HAD-IA family hydrolase [Rhodococcus pyridinivorans]QOW01845.1 HAD-IA family hydrolase [Rhodococcus pyridinivorans]